MFSPGQQVWYHAVCPQAATIGTFEGKRGIVKAIHSFSKYPTCGCSYRITVELEDGEKKGFHDKNLTTVPNRNQQSPQAPTASYYVQHPEAHALGIRIYRGNDLFNVVAVRTKAGYIGQIINAKTNGILWESEAFEDDPESLDNATLRTTGAVKAQKAAEEHINTSLESLLNGAAQ